MFESVLGAAHECVVEGLVCRVMWRGAACTYSCVTGAEVNI